MENKHGWIYFTRMLGRKQTKNQNETKRGKEYKQENNTEERSTMEIRRWHNIFTVYINKAGIDELYGAPGNWSQGTDTGNSGKKEQPAGETIVFALYVNSKVAFTK